jgi:hypothetical protein
VIFKPKDKGMQEALAEIDKDGSYKLSSYNKGDGAAPGEYVVVIEKVSYKNGAANEREGRRAAEVPERSVFGRYSDGKRRPDGLPDSSEVVQKTRLRPGFLFSVDNPQNAEVVFRQKITLGAVKEETSPH